jgi:hypothetical protein
MLEIYKETFIDLLVEQMNDYKRDILKIKENAARGTYVEGLTSVSVISENELLEVLTLGEKNRHVGQTKQNLHSSRSHSLFIIEII